MFATLLYGKREIKGWRREKKNDLVRTLNPLWKDLGQELFNRGR
jgi:predicted GIY-YIG superfamily endonuclease